MLNNYNKIFKRQNEHHLPITCLHSFNFGKNILRHTQDTKKPPDASNLKKVQSG